MRLIDADELERKARWYGSNTAGLIPTYELRNAPTVKAIPIEWINNWLNTGRNAKHFIPMMEMIEEWEKENE